MPYTGVSDLPKYVKKYPPKIQRMWMHVFNTVLLKTKSEERAFKAANAVLKKNMLKFGSARYGQSATFTYLIDSFLGKFNS